MADTQRSLAALQALFATNGQGDINAQDARDFLVSALLATEDAVPDGDGTRDLGSASKAWNELFARIWAARYDAARYGVLPTETAANNTTNLQAVLDAAGAAGGGDVLISTPGVYNLAEAGVHPYAGSRRYCIDIQNDNTRLILGPGVTLQLANGQQTDANGPVSMIVVGLGRSDIAIMGAGANLSVISGNTAGQTGWTGGYSAVGGAVLDFRCSTGSPGSRLSVRGLLLDDHFGHGVYGQDITGFTVRECVVDRVGEGYLGIRCDEVWWDDCEVRDSAGTYTQDGFELSGGNGFTLTNLRAFGLGNGGGGQAIDLFGPRDGIVSDCYFDGWVGAGVKLDYGTVSATESQNVLVENCIWKVPSGTNGTGFVVQKGGSPNDPAPFTNIHFNNCVSIGGSGFNINRNATAIKGPISVTNCHSEDASFSGDVGFSVGRVDGAYFEGCSAVGANNVGFAINLANVSGSEYNIVVRDFEARDCGGFGMLFTNSGFTSVQPTIVVDGVRLEGNNPGGTQMSWALTGPQSVNCRVDNVIPAEVLSVGSGGAHQWHGHRIITLNGQSIDSITKAAHQAVVEVQHDVNDVGDRTVFDKSHPSIGVHFNLRGGYNVVLAANSQESVTLRYNANTDEWYEIARSLDRPSWALPAVLAAGDNNDYVAVAETLLLRPDAAGSTLTGIVAKPPGTRLRIVHEGTSGVILTISHNDTASASGNRFFSGTTLDVDMDQHDVVDLEYDDILGGGIWRIVAANQF